MVEERPGQRQTGSKYGTVKMTVESIGIQAKIINNEEEKNGDEKREIYYPLARSKVTILYWKSCPLFSSKVKRVIGGRRLSWSSFDCVDGCVVGRELIVHEM